MNVQLYNTETREKETVSLQSDRLRIYTCGPTIYDFAHIGNFRTYVFSDLLRRTLKFFQFPVECCMNITDVDDKTMKGAIAKKISLKAFTDPFHEAFLSDLNTLNIEPVEHYPIATQFIPEMIEVIQTLIEKGYAYKSSNGSVYYSIRQFSSYGRLSHLNLSDLKVGGGGDIGEADEYGKESASDFVLWKAYDPERDGGIYWDSPFGAGRPGWHIECSAMGMKVLGETIDIHCGGVDLIFPHHENEIAQSEGCSGHHFVRHWAHVEHLLVDHRKMSKSLGNFYTLRDLLKKGYTGAEIRYLLLSTHYRTQLNFTMQGLDAARSSLQRIGDFILRLLAMDGQASSGVAQNLLERADLRFKAALADDLNISLALAALFDLIREINALLDQGKMGKNDAEATLALFSSWNAPLGVLPLEPQSEIPAELEALLHSREEARRQKNFQKSDQMRDAILSRGYLIEDTPQGARLKKR
jgi:cysteinyl-tRNA synthetase